MQQKKRARSEDADKEQSLVTLIQRTAPSMAIFDLDSTLWDGNCENFASATIVSKSEVVHPGTGRSLRLFPEVTEVLAAFAEAGIPLAIASASPAADTAHRLLRSFGLMQLGIKHLVVHPGSKDVHLRDISTALHAPLSRALFFDDLPHNIKAARSVGVGGVVLVRSGLKRDDVRQSLKALSEKSRGAALMRAWMGGTKSVTTQSSAPTNGSTAAVAGSTAAVGESSSFVPSSSSTNAPGNLHCSHDEDQGRAAGAGSSNASASSGSTFAISGRGRGGYYHETVRFFPEDDEDQDGIF